LWSERRDVKKFCRRKEEGNGRKMCNPTGLGGEQEWKDVGKRNMRVKWRGGKNHTPQKGEKKVCGRAKSAKITKKSE